jgi:hypothetical protein
VNAILPDEGFYIHRDAVLQGPYGARLFAEYKLRKLYDRGGRYCQIREDRYAV